jgi:hypothetical protein
VTGPAKILAVDDEPDFELLIKQRELASGIRLLTTAQQRLRRRAMEVSVGGIIRNAMIGLLA